MKSTKILLAICFLAFVQYAHAQYWNTTLGNPGGTGIYLGTNNPKPLDIQTNQVSRMYITSSGSIGINTTVPQATLHIDGYNYNLTNGVFTVRFPTASGTGLWNTEFSALTRPGVGVIGGNGFTALYAKSGSNNGTAAGYFDGKVVVANGSVGIGTNSPEDKLHVGEGIAKIVIGSATGTSMGYGTAYIGFNASRQSSSTWSTANDLAHNGAGIIYSDIFGSMFFSTIPNTGTTNQVNIPDATVLNNVRLVIGANGNIGIKTSAPMQALDVNGNIGINDNTILFHNNDSNHGLRYVGSGHPFAGNTAIDGPAIYGYGGGVLGSKDLGGSIEKIALRWNRDGNVGIGTNLVNNPNNYKLAVNGTIGAKSVKVEITSTTWADFVFYKNYKLRPLHEVEEFINSNKHLPEVPSADEIEKNGLDIGDMLKLQMQKIEELTLYIIELKKENTQIKQEIAQIKSKQSN